MGGGRAAPGPRPRPAPTPPGNHALPYAGVADSRQPLGRAEPQIDRLTIVKKSKRTWILDCNAAAAASVAERVPGVEPGRPYRLVDTRDESYQQANPEGED